jgi:hypothetical protein
MVHQHGDQKEQIMNKEHSKVEKLPAHEGDASAAPFVVTLGDVKVETRSPTGSDVIDSEMPLEHYAL